MTMKAQAYVDWLKTQAALKRPYWYGTFGNACTAELLQRKAAQYPSHYGANRMARYRQDIAAKQISADCVGGAIKWAVWSELGTKPPAYRSGGCPDASADGMFRHCRDTGMDWGAIGSMPDMPGVAVRSAGHVGVYVGEGKVVEWRGFRYGCVTTALRSRPWTHWYKLPWVEYPAAAEPEPNALLGSRLLKRGAKGADVRQLQLTLNELGFAAGNGDGIFGEETEAAVRRMQEASGIAVDGHYGEQSHAALMEWVSDAHPDPEQEPETARLLRVTGGRVNVRSGPGTQYRIRTIVTAGTELPFAAQAENGWFAVEVNGESGWISGKYAQVLK